MPENAGVPAEWDATLTVFGYNGKATQMKFTGGGSCACQNHISMYGVQTEKLQYDQGKEESSGEDGDQEILQVLPHPYTAQGN